MYRVLLVSGSMRRGSYTTALLREIGQVLQSNSEECQVQVWDLSTQPLPLYDADFEGNASDYPDRNVRDFVQAIRNADAIVFGTPTYHNSFTGALKNAIDWLDPADFHHKTIGLVGNSGGIRSVQALDQLRIVTRELSGFTIPAQVATSSSDFQQIGESVVLVDESVRTRIERFVEELHFLTTRLTSNEVGATTH